MLGIAVDEDLKRDKVSFLKQAHKTSLAVMNKFPACKQVANTFRLDADQSITYYTALFTQDRLYVSQEHTTDTVIDKIGSGDCFMAGLIYGNCSKLAAQQIIDFAAAAAFDKLFIRGDATTSKVEDIMKRIK